MRNLLLITAAILCVFVPSALAQVDAFGTADSVIVSQTTTYPGAKFSLSVTLVNDESLAAFAIPLIYSKEFLVFDSASFSGSLAKDWSYQTTSHDGAAGTLLVGAIAIGEAPILSGRGKLVELYFHAQSNISADVTTWVDSTFVPPAGGLELNTPDAIPIVPVFKPGKIVIKAANQAPVFEPMAARTVNEGDVVSFTVRASDPERSSIKLYSGRLCPGAQFVDNGNGSGNYTWEVPYVGPGSCSSSPTSVVIVASDGDKTSSLEITFDVINRNRVPVITVGSNLAAGAGDTLYVPFAATDPDFETVTFSAANLPAGAELGTTNPGYLRWVSNIADSGDYSFTLNAVDEAGGTTTKQVGFRLLPNMPIELTISDEQALSGDQVTISLVALNRVPISGFDVILGYDKTLLTYLSAVKTSTRVASWLQFDVVPTSDGKVAISARATPGNPSTNALAIGDGVIARITFQVSSNLAFAGQYSAVNFATINVQSPSENVAFGGDGNVIPRTQTLYETGGVLVKKYAGLIGDINLNGVAMEIGDVVYFTNYFINPFQYPLTGARLQNSDINQDGIPATLGDLVRLIQLFTGNGAKLAESSPGNTIAFDEQSLHGNWSYSLTAPADFAAAVFTLKADDDAAHSLTTSEELIGANVTSSQDGEIIRVLISQPEGRNTRLEAGALFEISGNVALLSQQFVDQNGNQIFTRLDRTSPLPTGYDLAQNYPNPFNPETSISFDLPKAGPVKLEIFNILGESISTLLDATLPAGHHEVTFRGTSASGAELPSGIYFYRLRAGQFDATRKMVLLK